MFASQPEDQQIHRKNGRCRMEGWIWLGRAAEAVDQGGPGWWHRRCGADLETRRSGVTVAGRGAEQRRSPEWPLVGCRGEAAATRGEARARGGADKRRGDPSTVFFQSFKKYSSKLFLQVFVVVTCVLPPTYYN